MGKFVIIFIVLFNIHLNAVFADDKILLVQNSVAMKGEVFNIPEQYFVDENDNKINANYAVSYWLRDAKTIGYKFLETSPIRRQDFMVPIQDPKTDQLFYVNINDITVDATYNHIIIKTDTAFFLEASPSNHSREELTHDFSPNCKHPSIKASLGVIEELTTDVTAILDHFNDEVEKKTKRNIANRGSTGVVIRNFNRTCKPYTFESFYPKLKAKAARAHVPVDILLGIMTQESSGRCGDPRHEFDNTQSVGLFQINTRSSEKPLCKLTQKDREKGITMQTHFEDEQCLQNPLRNLDEAIAILKQKYRYINRENPLLEGHHTFDELPLKQRNMWRKALSSYNGGEGHVRRSIKDVDLFNKLYSTEIDNNEWAAIRIFLMRRAVDRRGFSMFPEGSEYPKARGRTDQNIVYNLSYVDSIVHPEANGQTESQADKWLEFIESED